MIEAAAREANVLGVVLRAQRSAEPFYASEVYEVEDELSTAAGPRVGKTRE